jgi:hypothetical protein
MAVAREQLCGCTVSAAMREHAIMKETFPAGFMPRLHDEDQLPSQDSLDTAVRRVKGWCEMSVSLRGHELWSRGTFAIGRCHQAVQ